MIDPSSQVERVLSPDGRPAAYHRWREEQGVPCPAPVGVFAAFVAGWEAAQRPPLGYIVGLQSAGKWYTHSSALLTEDEAVKDATSARIQSPLTDWRIAEVREVQP